MKRVSGESLRGLPALTRLRLARKEGYPGGCFILPSRRHPRMLDHEHIFGFRPMSAPSGDRRTGETW